MPGDDEPALFHVDVRPVRHVGGRTEGPQGFEVQFHSFQGDFPDCGARTDPVLVSGVSAITKEYIKLRWDAMVIAIIEEVATWSLGVEYRRSGKIRA